MLKFELSLSAFKVIIPIMCKQLVLSKSKKKTRERKKPLKLKKPDRTPLVQIDDNNQIVSYAEENLVKFCASAIAFLIDVKNKSENASECCCIFTMTYVFFELECFTGKIPGDFSLAQSFTNFGMNLILLNMFFKKQTLEIL